MINIIFSCDENYAPYLSVTILSIFKSNKNNRFNIYVLDLGISNESKQYIQSIVDAHKSKIQFISIDLEDFSVFPTTIGYISIATYARLKIADYIKDIDKAIYLDVDVLVNGDLSELWNINLTNYAIGACYDSYIESELPTYKRKIGLNDENYYFNAGVLLINLAEWKNKDVFNSSIEWLKRYPDIKFQDQDILNGIFRDSVYFINTRFNFMPTLRHKIKKHKMISDLEKPVNPIVIYHYCSSTKVWNKKCNHNKSILFYDLVEMLEGFPSAWKNKFEKINFYHKIEKRLKDIKYKFIYRIY